MMQRKLFSSRTKDFFSCNGIIKRSKLYVDTNRCWYRSTCKIALILGASFLGIIGRCR